MVIIMEHMNGAYSANNTNLTNATKQTGISGYTLKMIAVISMLIDHSAATILERMLTTEDMLAFPLVSDNWNLFYLIYKVMRGIGRFAFPIYCYLLVEGFFHTRSVKKYALRLFLFAILSEIPFDLAFSHTLLEFHKNNVFLTLFIGLLVIVGIRFFEQLVLEKYKNRFPTAVKWMLFVIALIVLTSVGALLAEYVFFTDYGASGVLAIVILYLFYRHRLIGFALATVELTILSSDLEIVALLMLLPMMFYNGTRGRQVKYFFYAFYPAHLLLLVGICWCFGLK